MVLWGLSACSLKLSAMEHVYLVNGRVHSDSHDSITLLCEWVTCSLLLVTCRWQWHYKSDTHIQGGVLKANIRVPLFIHTGDSLGRRLVCSCSRRTHSGSCFNRLIFPSARAIRVCTSPMDIILLLWQQQFLYPLVRAILHIVHHCNIATRPYCTSLTVSSICELAGKCYVTCTYFVSGICAETDSNQRRSPDTRIVTAVVIEMMKLFSSG